MIRLALDPNKEAMHREVCVIFFCFQSLSMWQSAAPKHVCRSGPQDVESQFFHSARLHAFRSSRV